VSLSQPWLGSLVGLSSGRCRSIPDEGVSVDENVLDVEWGIFDACEHALDRAQLCSPADTGSTASVKVSLNGDERCKVAVTLHGSVPYLQLLESGFITG